MSVLIDQFNEPIETSWCIYLMVAHENLNRSGCDSCSIESFCLLQLPNDCPRLRAEGLPSERNHGLLQHSSEMFEIQDTIQNYLQDAGMKNKYFLKYFNFF